VAVTTLRFKVLSIPYMCVLAAAGVSDHVIWSTMLGWIRVKGQLVSAYYVMLPKSLYADKFHCVVI